MIPSSSNTASEACVMCVKLFPSKVLAKKSRWDKAECCSKGLGDWSEITDNSKDFEEAAEGHNPPPWV